MGRNRAEPGRRKTIIVQVRMTIAQRKEVREKARGMGLELSTFMRLAAISYKAAQ